MGEYFSSLLGSLMMITRWSVKMKVKPEVERSRRGVRNFSQVQIATGHLIQIRECKGWCVAIVCAAQRILFAGLSILKIMVEHRWRTFGTFTVSEI